MAALLQHHDTACGGSLGRQGNMRAPKGAPGGANDRPLTVSAENGRGNRLLTSSVRVRRVPCESARIPQRPPPTTLRPASCPSTSVGVRARPAETARIFARYDCCGTDCDKSIGSCRVAGFNRNRTQNTLLGPAELRWAATRATAEESDDGSEQ